MVIFRMIFHLSLSNMFLVTVFVLSYYLSYPIPYFFFFLSLPWLISHLDYFTNLLVFLTTKALHSRISYLSHTLQEMR